MQSHRAFGRTTILHILQWFTPLTQVGKGTVRHAKYCKEVTKRALRRHAGIGIQRLLLYQHAIGIFWWRLSWRTAFFCLLLCPTSVPSRPHAASCFCTSTMIGFHMPSVLKCFSGSPASRPWREGAEAHFLRVPASCHDVPSSPLECVSRKRKVVCAF